MRDGGLKREDGSGAAALRLFVAISLPDAVEEEIEKVQQEMRKELRGNVMRWTKREQFHLTLKFLGNVAEARVGELSESLREVCVAFGAMRLCAGRVGFFPDARFPRVMWVGVRDEQDGLSRLQEAIEVTDSAAISLKIWPGGTPVPGGICRACDIGRGFKAFDRGRRRACPEIGGGNGGTVFWRVGGGSGSINSQ